MNESPRILSGAVALTAAPLAQGSLQAGQKVKNPYSGSSVYGPSMLKCGTVKTVHAKAPTKEG